jgi:hypothetical protein
MPLDLKGVRTSDEGVEITFSKNLGTYFQYGTVKSSIWQYFNPNSREWNFIKVQKLPFAEHDYSIIIRNGWVIRKLERIVETPYYYYCENNDLKNITKHDAIIKGYQYSPGILKVPAVKKDDNVFVNVRKVYFPTEVFKILRELSVMQKEEDGRILYLCFKSTDIQKVYQLLYPIRIRLEYQKDFIEEVKELDPTEIETLSELPKFLSEILTLSYSNFLKKEERIEKFLLTLIYRDLTKIHNEDLKKKLEELFDLCNKGDYICKQILDFLIESITTYFDWDCYENWKVDSNIDGLIFKATPLSYNEKWSNTYYKIIFPELETVLHWTTTISPTKKGIGEFHELYARLKEVKMIKWRIYPYLGRIKNTGTREDNIFEEGEKEFVKKSFDSVLGIPSFERILAEREYLSSFSLDLEDWHGHYYLDRYFLAIVKIVDPLLLDFPFPRTKVEDIFGNKFIIEWNWDAYVHSKEDIHNFGPGGWFSILLKNIFGKRRFTNIECPIFQTAQTIKPFFHNKDLALRYNFLALIKYFGYIPRGGFKNLSHFFSEQTIDVILNDLLEKNLVYQKDENIYYVYKCLNKEQMNELIELMTVTEKIPHRDMYRQKWYITWSLIRGHYPLIHPLIYANKLSKDKKLEASGEEVGTYSKLEEFIDIISTHHKNEIKRRRAAKINFFINNRKPNINQGEVKIGEKDEDKYVNYASLMIYNFGNVTILGSGSRIPKAHSIVQKVVRKFAYMEPKVVRTDSPLQHKGGFTVPAVKFEIEMFSI